MSNYIKKITTVKSQYVEISEEEAKSLIVDAKINVPGELDCYKKEFNPGFIERVFTLKIPNHWTAQNKEPKELLDYARNNLPDNLRI